MSVASPSHALFWFSCFTAQMLSVNAAQQMLSVNAAQTSDLFTTTEDRALDTKAEQFWQSVLTAAQDSGMETLPPENTYVREALNEALMRLKRADDVVLKQAMESSQLATAKLASPVGSTGMSFFLGGQNFSDRLIEHIGQRQADILPSLRVAASSAGNVLTDCRLASARSFDVLKYDIYEKDVPKTPETAKDLANRLIDAIGKRRQHFTGFITRMAESITRDIREGE